MEKLFESTIINLLTNSAYSKIVNHTEEVKKDSFDELFTTLSLMTGSEQRETHVGMLKVQAREAVEEGYIKDINGEETDNPEAVSEVLSGYGIEMVFDFTDKGKSHFLPLVKSQIKERLRIVAEKLDEVIPTEENSGCGNCTDCSCSK